MKTYEITNVMCKAAQHVKATDMDALFAIAEEIRDASAKPLKKSTEVYIWKIERVNRSTYRDVFEWVACDADGAPLTPTGRKMTANHEAYAWK